MKHFYYVPRVNLKKSMQHIFACFKEKGITDEELKTQFFDMTGKEDKRLSDTVLYNWKKGKHFPDLDKIFTIRCLLQKPVEELFIFEYSYVETEVPKKERGISGTKIFFITADRESDGIIKPKLRAFLLPEENLSIEELQAKYPQKFSCVKNLGNSLKQDSVIDKDKNPKELRYRPSTDPAAISQNFFRVINELRFPQKNLQLILGLHNVQTISNWKTKKGRKPKTETLLNFVHFIRHSFEEFCDISFCVRQDLPFDEYSYRFMYPWIHNKSFFESEYEEYIRRIREQWEEYKAEVREQQLAERAEWDKIPLLELLEKLKEWFINGIYDDAYYDTFYVSLNSLTYLQSRMKAEGVYDEYAEFLIEDYFHGHDIDEIGDDVFYF